MAESTDRRASLQLGMNYGKAHGRLWKQVILWLAKQLGLDFCFRCGKRIETLQELSLDHKLPWLDVDPALYWDVENNIAFSHFDCNVKAARRPFRSPEFLAEVGRAVSRSWTKRRREAQSKRAKNQGKTGLRWTKEQRAKQAERVKNQQPWKHRHDN